MDAGRGVGRPLGLESAEVGLLRRRSSLAQESTLDIRASRLTSRGVGDDSVAVLLLDPLVDDGTAPVIDHLGAKDGVLVIPCARAGDDASSLGKEDGDGEVLGVFLQLVVGRLGVCAGVAPRVRVEREEVDSLRRVATASEVILEHGAKLQDVGSRVSNGDVTVALGITVRLHVAGSSLEIGSRGRIIFSSNVLISNENTQQVVVLLEGIQDLGISVELCLIPVVIRLYNWSDNTIQKTGKTEKNELAHRNNVSIKGIQVSKDVNAGVVKRLHAAIMVRRGVDVVHANGVCSELGHELGIALALVSVNERILGPELVRNA